MAQCYTHEHLAMDAMGVRCYQRAIQNGDKEFVALPNLAKLYAKMGLEDQAVGLPSRSLSGWSRWLSSHRALCLHWKTSERAGARDVLTDVSHARGCGGVCGLQAKSYLELI